MRKFLAKNLKYILIIFSVLLIIFVLPILLALSIEEEQKQPVSINNPPQFPVTVDPVNKVIVENTEVNAYLEGNGTSSPLEASVFGAVDNLWETLKSLAMKIAEAPWYQSIASVSGIDGKLVSITPGMRKEQVVNVFARALNWNNEQKQEFINLDNDHSVSLNEGAFFPDSYFVDKGMTPTDVKKIIDKNFKENVLSHYGTSTAKIVPIDQALTIASIIQRETIGNKDMRLISGIIWNRIFNNMNLQVDATLQYAKANTSKTKTDWWPDVVPKDKYIKSPYNTYLHKGLPPTPIANPSVGAILATLNPLKTDCLYYFNDKAGNFHCSLTYKEHVKMIDKYY